MWFAVECSGSLVNVLKIVKSFLQLVQFLIPIGLIVMGSLDLGKAVLSADEDGIKKGQTMLLKRSLAAVLVFLVAVIVNFVMNFIGNNTWQSCWKSANNNNVNINQSINV